MVNTQFALQTLLSSDDGVNCARKK